MATKEVNQPHLEDAIEHFGIDCDPYGIMVSATSGDIVTVYADESTYTYNKILRILSDHSDDTLAPDLDKLKKAFIFPNANLSQDRIKAALKEHKVTVTNDYEQADLYLTHDYIDRDFESGETINSRTMMPKLWNYDAVEGGGEEITNYTHDSNNMRSGELARVIVDEKIDGWVNRYTDDYETHSMPSDSWLLTGMAVNCAYKVEKGEAEVWSIEKVMNQSATKVEITEQLIEDLKSLSGSYSDEDTNMVAAILPTIKYKENYHLLWQLAQDIGGSLYRCSSRNKDVQFWIGVSQIEDHYNRSALDMINYLEGKEILESKTFKYLESIVRKEIRIENRDLYTFRVELKPEYKQYLKNKTNG
jgi:hypothetical protein